MKLNTRIIYNGRPGKIIGRSFATRDSWNSRYDIRLDDLSEVWDLDGYELELYEESVNEDLYAGLRLVKC